MTISQVVGFVGGAAVETQVANRDAFVRGVASLRPHAQVLSGFAGTFDDRRKGQLIASGQIDAGADVISQTADVSGLGVIDVCRERGVKTTGYAMDQSVLAPGCVLTSLILDVPSVIVTKVRELLSGSFRGGDCEQGLAHGMVALGPFSRDVDDRLRADLRQTQVRIIAGEIALPD
jgi:basic membrane protein A